MEVTFANASTTNKGLSEIQRICKVNFGPKETCLNRPLNDGQANILFPFQQLRCKINIIRGNLLYVQFGKQILSVEGAEQLVW